MDILQIEDKAYLIYRCVYPPVKSNMYTLIDGKDSIIIDTDISEELAALLKEKGVERVHLFLTHEHYDHSHGVTWLKENFDVTLYCHELCSEGLSTKSTI